MVRSVSRLIPISLLTICLSLAWCFASDSPEQGTPEGFSWVDQDQVKVLELSEKAAAATEYTTTDIYNYLTVALGQAGTSTSYSLPYMAYRTNQIYTRLGTMNTTLSTVSNTLTNIFDSLAGNGAAFTVLDALYYQTNSGNQLPISELLSYIWVHTDNLDSLCTNAFPLIVSSLNSADSKLSLINTSVGSVKTSVDSVKSSVDSVGSKISTLTSTVNSFPEQFDYIQWDLVTSSVTITSDPLASSPITPIANQPVYYVFNLPRNTVESVLNFRLPYYHSRFFNPSVSDIEFGYISGGQLYPFTQYIRFIDFNALSGSLQVYVADTRFQLVPSTFSYYIKFTPPFTSSVNPNFTLSSPQIRSVSDPSNDFYTVYGWLRSRTDSMILDRLADRLAPDNVAAAEAASQAVIDDTLDGFTGSGSAAAKVNDTSSMKNVSGSLRSGLETGAGVSNATSVFTLGSDFWLWFSQDTSDMINSPYPAPVVQQMRGSGDEIVDFLSGNEAEVQNLLRGSEW